MRQNADDVVNTMPCGLAPEKFDIGICADFAGQSSLEGGTHDDQVEGAEQDTLT